MTIYWYVIVGLLHIIYRQVIVIKNWCYYFKLKKIVMNALSLCLAIIDCLKVIVFISS